MKITAQEFADKITGRLFSWSEILTKEEQLQADENNFIIAIGASDDLVELYGAIRFENVHTSTDGYNNTFISKVLMPFDELDELNKNVRKTFLRIIGYYSDEGIWVISAKNCTDCETAVFKVYEKSLNEKIIQCIGLVIDVTKYIEQ